LRLEPDASYRLLFEKAPEPQWICDRASLAVLAVNDTALRHYGYARPEFLALHLHDLFLAKDASQILDRWHALERSDEASVPQPATVYRQRRKDGSTVEMKISAAAVAFQGRAAFLVLASDVSERRRAEASLGESEERHRLIAELTSDYAYTARVHADGRITIESATGGFTRVTGYTVEELERRGGWPSLMHPDDMPLIMERHAAMLAGKRDVFEARIVTRAGETRWIRYSTHPVWDDAAGRVVQLLGAVQDITEGKHAQDQLQAYARKLQALSRRLLDVQEQERRSLACELHDEIGQMLTGLEFTLGQHRNVPGEQVARSLAKAQGLVRELTTRVRRLSLRLRPTMLDDLGLLAALLWHLEGFGERTRVRVDFAHCGLDGRFDPEIETGAYRIVQEALTNVARHAQTGAATVRAWQDGAKLYLQVEDTGVGFDDQAVRAGPASSGLSGMQERAELLGGMLTIESRLGGGTRVSAELPLGNRRIEASHGTDPPPGG
jgi:PAS domain S-box-containing protein